ARGRGGLVGFLLADGAPVGEALQALVLLLRELVARARLGEHAARLLELDLEGRALDAKERRPGLHRVAFAVELALEDPGNARAHLHFARALRAPDRLEADRHRARRHLEQRHAQGFGRAAGGRGRLFRSVLRAAGRAGGEQKNHQDREPLHGAYALRKQSTMRAVRRASSFSTPFTPKSRFSRSWPTSMPRKISAASSGSSRRSSPAVMARES